MTHTLNLSLLGALSISVDGRPIEVDSTYVRALLLYLAIEKKKPHRREALAEMLWAERPDRVARNSLKQALSNLRTALGDRDRSNPYLLVSRYEIQFNQSSHYWSDADEFTECIESCEEHAHDELLTCPICENWLLQGVGLYQGDFLAGFYLPDNQDFNDWVILKREAFHRRMSSALRKLARIHESRGEYTRASDWCRQLADLEPWNEENHRNLMRLLALRGMRSAALRQYQICCENLKNELGVEPSNATKTLYEQIETWDLETFPEAAPPQIQEETNHLAIIPENNNATQPSSPKNRSGLLAFILALVTIIVGIGSIFWVGVSRLQATALDFNGQNLSRNSPTSTTNILMPMTASPSVSSSGGIPEIEIQALVNLYEQTNGLNWAHSDGWLSDISPCQWYGITCRRGKIVELALYDNRLTGSLPVEIGQLGSLEKLDLGDNQLRGIIPPEIGNLSNLQHLILWGNRELTGPIPPELGRLSNLEDLNLAHWESGGSLLSGEIPPELGNLKNLRSLNISLSLLSGPMPVELYGLTNLENLFLDSNRLSGTILPEIGNLINLQALDLGGNDFEGPLPSELGNLRMLDYFAVGGSLISGEVPAELGNSLRLRHLVLDNTGLSGPLPLALMNLNLRELTYFGTGVCAPPDEAFEAWLEGIDELDGSGVVCERDVEGD